MRIARDGDTLRWQGIGLDRPMGHRHYDVFEIAAEPTVWFENRTVQFATSVEGDIESLAVPLEPQVAPIVFRRLPPPEMATREFLEPLTGVYRLGNIVFRIALDRAGQLTFTRNQAATERLLPRHGHIFGFPDSEFFRDTRPPLPTLQRKLDKIEKSDLEISPKPVPVVPDPMAPDRRP